MGEGLTRASGSGRVGRRGVLAAVLIALSSTASDASAQPDRWLGRDKALHFAAGAAIALGGYALGGLVFDGRSSRVAVGVSLGLGAGAAKELRDWRGGGTASWRDFTWTAGGTAAGVTAGWLIDRARQRQGGAPAPAIAPGASIAVPAGSRARDVWSVH